MKLHFFTIPARHPEQAQERLNAFFSQHRILTVDKQFVALGHDSFWSLCVTSLEGEPHNLQSAMHSKRDRVDYKEVLSEHDFTLYAQLRNLRKTLSEQEGVPAYALFTNEQLAAMITRGIGSEAELAQIEGIGKARQEKYGKAFVDLLNSIRETQTGSDDAAPKD